MPMEQPKPNVAFRADGDPRIGMGHLMRCLALAKELKEQAAEIIFIGSVSPGARELIQKNNCTLLEMGEFYGRGEVNTVKEIIKNYDISIVITDSYAIGFEYLKEIRACGCLLISIDDLNQAVYPSHVVINGNIYAHKLAYKSAYGDTEFLLGTDYLLLREEFVKVTPRQLPDEVTHLMVTVGGSDPLDLTPKIIAGLGQVDADFRLSVVVGPGFTSAAKIKTAIENVGKQVELRTNTDNMAALMSSCDAAVTAGGTTLYELCRTGTPAVVLLQAENQILAAGELNDVGTIINLGMGNEVQVPEITKAVDRLCRDPQLRRSMAARGQTLVDGLGARRCAERIMKRYNTLKRWGINVC